ncbi:MULTISPECIES: hypothetical protein [unclassified Sphingobium]
MAITAPRRIGHDFRGDQDDGDTTLYVPQSDAVRIGQQGEAG